MATFYIEAIENTTITLSKVGSPTVGTAKYGINNTNPSTTYTYGNNISLSAGQKCYWTITSTTTAFSSSNYLKFTSTGKINVGGALSDLIGGQSSIPRNFCFARLFIGCNTLVDASKLICIEDLASKTYCYYGMFYNCTSLNAAPELPATTLRNFCYGSMFEGCINLKLSETQTGVYQKPYRIPSSGTGTLGTSSLSNMFKNTGGTFTGTPSINTTYYMSVPAPPTYTLTYSTEHGTAPSPKSDISTLSAEDLPGITTEGYNFTGWYYDSGFTTEAKVGDTISANTTLYAKWVEQADNVFILNNKPLELNGIILGIKSTPTVTGETWIINESPLPPEREIEIGAAYESELGYLNVYRLNVSVGEYQIKKETISWIKIEAGDDEFFQLFYGCGLESPSLNAYANWWPIDKMKWSTGSDTSFEFQRFWTTDSTPTGEPLSAEQRTLLRTIELNEPATGDLLTWLQANAVKQ